MSISFRRALMGFCSASLMLPNFALAATGINTAPGADVIPYVVPAAHEPHLSAAQMASLIRHHIKYVFVIYQENRSFDSYFGTYPGADGLYSQPASATPGFTQPITNVDGSASTIQPFLIGRAQYAADTDDIDHSHPLTAAKMDIVNGTALMDHFALTEEKKYSKTENPSLLAKQFGELSMAYEDCDTVPILWNYASRFTLFDHVFEDMAGPSTPGNLSIFAAQTGETQLAKHPDQAWKTAGDAGEPVINDDDPKWGSPSDPSGNKNVPVNPHDYSGKSPYKTQLNQTYASLALTTAGNGVKAEAAKDEDPKGDLDDVNEDISFIQSLNKHQVAWRWFEEGYGSAASDTSGPTDATGQHAGYITHHNGPQYFGYVANNPQMRANMQGLHAMFSALQTASLPKAGGVFYIKGGYQNIFGMTPADPDAKVQKAFVGDDDHPAYSDAGISESLVARTVNAIAASPYWSQSAIIITWDDSEGDYDHVPPPLTDKGPDGSVVSEGPRVPMLLISPYAKVHNVSHEMGSQSSVVKFVDAVFGLPALASLPDEKKGFELGKKEFNQTDMGPTDGNDPNVGNLFSAFDAARLSGHAKPLPASYAEVPDAWASKLPEQSGASCKAIGIVPVNVQLGIPNNIPADFNPRPHTNPTKVAQAPAPAAPSTPANAVPAAPGAMAPAKSN